MSFMSLYNKWPIGVMLIGIYVTLITVSIWSLFLWKKSSGIKKAMYFIGGILSLLLTLMMTAVFISPDFGAALARFIGHVAS
jgi:hypothetical protein